MPADMTPMHLCYTEQLSAADEEAIDREDEVVNSIHRLGYAADVTERGESFLATATEQPDVFGKRRDEAKIRGLRGVGRTAIDALLDLKWRLRHHEASRFLEPGEVIVREPSGGRRPSFWGRLRAVFFPRA